MSWRERRAIDARLPPLYRHRWGFNRLLEDIPLRISVSGIRGKSSLVKWCEEEYRARGFRTYAKQTGTDPISIKDGVAHPIPRNGRKGALLEENLRELKKYWPMDVAVLENQAITPYTMRVFNHRFCRPHYLLVTNVRRDHQGDIARTLPLSAKAFASSAPPGCTLISGEPNPEIAGILRAEAEAVGARFLDAAPRGGPHPPAYESLTILDALLRESTGRGLDPATMARRRARFLDFFRWRPSALPGVSWFHGAEINDIDSSLTIHRFLQHRRRLPTSFIAYFRADRRDRSASFVEFLRQGFEQGWCERAYIAGGGSRVVARHLRAWRERVRWYPDDVSEVPRLLADVARECRGEAVMTIVNAVPPFPRAVWKGLSADGQALPTSAPAALRARAAAPLVRFERVRGPRPRQVAA